MNSFGYLYLVVCSAVICSVHGAVYNPDIKSASGNIMGMFNTTFNDATVKLTICGVDGTSLQNVDIGPENASLLLTRYSCQQANLAAISTTVDGKLEVSLHFICETRHYYALPGYYSIVSYIALVIGVCICIFLVAVYARKALTADGEIRWRLWRVPRRSYVAPNPVIYNLQSGHVVDSNDTVYTDDNISAILSQTMLMPFISNEKK